MRLEVGETYLSCRRKCLESYPEFQFYLQSPPDNKCKCSQVSDSDFVKVIGEAGCNFGYAESCGKAAAFI